MATNAGSGAARQVASATKTTAVWKKYTVQSHGIWDRIRRALAIDADRSTGVPLNPQYRNPPPGANPPEAYDDPVTVPAGDIAENPYYKRDIRRSYPRLSVVKPADVVGLLSVGSKANPKEDVLQIGDAGAKQLVQVKQQGEEKGLAAFFQKEKNVTAGIFGPDGLPPFPSGMSRTSPVGGRKYVMDADREQGYPEDPAGFKTSYLSVHTRTQLEYVLVLEPRIVYMHLNFYRQDATYAVTFRMAIPTYSKKSSSLAALDIILSCTICQQPFPAIYADDDELHGLRKSDAPHDDRVTKLWLTECCHLSCGKHFEGGGVPFHSDQQTPSAPCPLCITEKDDRSDKALFYIYGTSKGEYDSNIPDSYFQTPPVALGGAHPGFDALLFQYLSLIRFGSKIYENALLSRNALRRWEERKPEIVRSLSSIGPMREELLAAGRRLIALGQDVTSIETVLSSVGASLARDLQRRLDEQQLHMNTAPVNNNTPSCNLPDVGSRLARGSAADLDRLTKGAEALATQEPAMQLSPSKDEHSAKRKRGDSLREFQTGLRDGLGSSHHNTCHSRDLMPPPPSPRRPYAFTGHVLTPNLVDPPFVPTLRHPPTITGPITPRRQTSQAQNTGVPVNGNELNHRSSVDSNGVVPQGCHNQRSSLVSKESFERTPRRHPNHRSSSASMSAFEKGPPRDQDLNTACRIRLPAQLGGRSTDIEDPSSQAITTSSSYQDGNLLGARRSSEALSHTSRTARRLLANPSPGRLTLTPRYSNEQRHGLSANVRTSNDRLGTAASPHFGQRYRPYSSSLPPHNNQTLGENWRHMDSFDAAPAPTAGIRYMNPFESGPTAINSQMRPYSSTAQAKNFLLAQHPAFDEAARRREQALSTQPALAERMQQAQPERGGGPVTPATASRRSTLNNAATRGSSNVADPRDSAPASRSGRRPAQR